MEQLQIKTEISDGNEQSSIIDIGEEYVTEVKLDLDPIEIDNIIKIEDDDEENCFYLKDDYAYNIPYKTQIIKKFMDLLNCLPKNYKYLDPLEFKKIEKFILNLSELVKRTFLQLENTCTLKIKKVVLYRKNMRSYKRKLQRILPKFNECVKFIDFIKKNKKLFATEIKNYLINHQILRLNKIKIDAESDNVDKIKDAVDHEEIFDEDATSECTENLITVERDENLQQPETMCMKISQVNSISDLMENEENCQFNTVDDFNENFSSESDNMEADTNDDELFKIIPEENKNKQNYKKLDTGQYQCNICQKNSPNYSGFLQHTITHEEQTLICHLCGKLFENHKKCIMHVGQCRQKTVIIRKRKLVIEGGGMHSGIDFKKIATTEYCPKKNCNKRFVSKNFKYFEHLDFHVGIKPYFCKTCSRHFQFAYNLFAHLKTKSKCSLANCTLPKYAPDDVTNYDEYIEVATSHYSHVCNVCGRKMETKFKLLEHQNSHIGEKPYLCSCGCSYKTYANLSCHVRKSNCNIDLCKLPDYFDFARMRNIKKESTITAMKDNLTDNQDNVRQKKKYICTECDNLELGTYMRLKTHRQAKHMEKKFECEECHKKFSTLPTLKTHLRKVHIGAYKCDICKLDRLMTFGQYSFHNSYFHNMNNSGHYQCKVCEEQFQNNNELILHVNAAWHTSARNTLYFCLICNQKYKYLDFLKHLNQSSHTELEMNWRNKFNINKLICFFCNENIDKVPDYLKHLDIKHHESNFEKHLQRLVDDVNTINN